MIICPKCQKLFNPNKMQIYCSEKCRKSFEKRRARERTAPARKARHEAYLAGQIPLWNAARLRRWDQREAKRLERSIARAKKLKKPRGIRAEPVTIADPAAILVRLEASSVPEPNSGCQLWLGPVWDDGYGRIQIGGRYRRVARVALAVYKGGSLPRNVLALHHCDQPTCIAENHLYAGTAKNNHDDMVKRGRKAPLPHARRSGHASGQ